MRQSALLRGDIMARACHHDLGSGNVVTTKLAGAAAAVGVPCAVGTLAR